MSVHIFYENNDGDWVEAEDLLRADTLELSQRAEEASVGESSLVFDDPAGTFYVRGHKPMAVFESEASGDEWLGLIGLFYTWDRSWRRGDHRTAAGCEITISLKDVNTLLTRRVQKGNDAERPEETDIVRITDWLIDTTEVVGGSGDAGFGIEERSYVFTDSPYPMSATDYTSQDSAGVINDALQDSGKNAYIYPAPDDPDAPIRVGMWYGRTEREDFASIHRISNVPSDITADTLDPAWMFDPVVDYDTPITWAPSLDAELNRDPSRVASGVMVMADGSYAYVTRPETADAFASRDMVMQAELVKTQAQAERRATRYVRDLRNEDDAVQVSVLVPSAYVNAFVQGQRVQYRSSYQPGYKDGFVWLRVASRTVRQTSAGSGLYTIAMDLRAEEPPDAPTTGSGSGSSETVCADGAYPETPSGTYSPLGGSGDTPNVSDGVIYYVNPGRVYPIVPTPGHHGHVHFPTYGGPGGDDTWGDCCQNCLRVLVVGDGHLAIDTVNDGSSTTLYAQLCHHRYGDDGTGGVTIFDQTITGITPGSTIEVDVSTHGGQNCIHWVDVKDGGGLSCGNGWGFSGAVWDLGG